MASLPGGSGQAAAVPEGEAAEGSGWQPGIWHCKAEAQQCFTDGFRLWAHTVSLPLGLTGLVAVSPLGPSCSRS